MKKKYNLLEKLILQIIKLKVKNWFNLEKTLAQKDGYIKSNDLSPEKTWPNPEKIPAGGEIPFTMQNIKVIGKYLRSCISEGTHALKSLKNNPVSPLNTITQKQLEELELQRLRDQEQMSNIAFSKLDEGNRFAEFHDYINHHILL